MLAVLCAAGLAACSDDATTVDAGDDATTTTTVAGTSTTGVPVPAGLVLRITTGGGFLPAELSFATVAPFTLYHDGRVVVPGPATLEYPGEALPNLLTGTVGRDDVRDAVEAARDAGVADAADLGRPPVADAPTTSFVLVDGGTTFRAEAYALDLDEGPGLSAGQRDGRRRLRGLVAGMERLGAAATAPYRAGTVSVLVRPYDDVDRGSPPAEPAPGEADWPLGDLAAGGREQFGGRCLGFTGADAERVLGAAAEARSNTRWRSGGTAWALTFRPELPGDPPCPAR